MCSEIVIKVKNLSKCYQIYDTPRDRLKQFLLPHAQRLLKTRPKNYFKEFWALKNVSLEVKRGETVGIIGRNGSGKSTLLEMICGTLNPSQGSIKTSGRIAALLELGSGFNPEFTGRENVYLNGAILGLSEAEINDRYDEILAFADIGDYIERPVKTYSSGMVVRLAFAVAATVQPDILVVDEALAVGDEAFQRKCFARIEDIKRAGGTILFVTHSTQTVIELCERTLLLRQGEAVYFGSSHQAVNLYYRLINNPNGDLKQDLGMGELNEIGRSEGATNLVGQIEHVVVRDVGEVGEAGLDQQVSDFGFDDSLISQTRHEIHEQRYGATISDIKLQNISGMRGNILRPNSRYLISFNTEFKEYIPGISYQILFKTVNGIPIAGDKFFHDKITGYSVSLEQKFHVDYEFQCLMNPGVYFVSIEICGNDEGDEVVLHKFSEVIAFRVILVERRTAIGYMSLMPSIKMREI